MAKHLKLSILFVGFVLLSTIEICRGTNGTESAGKDALTIGAFVKEARKLASSKGPITIITGNEGCDLDSAVSAISLAYSHYRSRKTPESLLTNGKHQFLPVMNIFRSELVLKSDVTYLLQKNGVDLKDVVCSRDELPTALLKKSKIILVDHHVAVGSVPEENVLQIFDHRPFDKKNAHIPDKAEVDIREVASCATLIASRIILMEQQNIHQYADVLGFLRGPIVLDTFNFSPKAGKSRKLDTQINKQIEEALNLDASNRRTLFSDLFKAWSDVSQFTAMQLLQNDLKVVKNKAKIPVVYIAAFPMLCENFIKMKNAWECIQQFSKEKKVDFLVMMGGHRIVSGDDLEIYRDMAIIGLRRSDLYIKITDALVKDNADYLRLKEKLKDTTKSLKSLSVKIYDQENVVPSRKQVQPIIQNAVDNL